MIDFSKVGRRAKLLYGVDPDDPTLTLNADGAQRLAPSDGQQLYLTLTAGPQNEIVLVTSTSGNSFTVARGQDGTIRQNFPAGTCVESAWNRAQMAAFVQSLVNPAACGGYTGKSGPGDILTFQNGLCTDVRNGGGC